MKILVPLDLVQPLPATIDSLRALLILSKCDVYLLYVHELLPAYENLIRTAGVFPDDWEKQIDERAKAALEKAAAAFKPHCQSVSAQIVSGPAAMMIESVAKDGHFDLIMLAPRRHNAAERFFSGSVSSKVVQHAAGTVVLSRPESLVKSQKLTSVVFAYDGSDNAKHAIARALELFPLKEQKAKITVVHAIDLAEPIKLFSPVSFVSSLEQNLLMHGETLLAEAEAQLSAAGISGVDLRLVEGEPAGQIIKAAKEAGAELIVTGAQGHAAVQHFLVGSVSEKVSNNADCSVAVVKMQ